MTSELKGKILNVISFTEALRRSNFTVENSRKTREIRVTHSLAREFAALVRFSGRPETAVVTHASVVGGPTKRSIAKADRVEELLRAHVIGR